MGKRRPPDILRKSHAHTEGRARAKARRSLHEDLSDELEESRSAAGVLVDLDGVVYAGDGAVAGAAEALAWLESRAVPHLFVTNTTSQPRSAIVEKLARLGIEVAAGRILTPPVAALRWLREHVHGPAALFVPAATRAEFEGCEIAAPGSRAAAVVVGDYGSAWTFDELNRAFRLLTAKPPPVLVALGMTRYWRAADGLRLDTAPFVVALAYASGVEPVVLGKPAQAFFGAALELLGSPASRTVMIGDDVAADVEGAQALGIRGVLVRTGKFRDGDLDRGIEPAAVWDSLADLPSRLPGLLP